MIMTRVNNVVVPEGDLLKTAQALPSSPPLPHSQLGLEAVVHSARAALTQDGPATTASVPNLSQDQHQHQHQSRGSNGQIPRT